MSHRGFFRHTHVKTVTKREQSEQSGTDHDLIFRNRLKYHEIKRGLSLIICLLFAYYLSLIICLGSFDFFVESKMLPGAADNLIFEVMTAAIIV